MAVVTGGVASRVGDVPGDSGTTWPRSSRGGEPEKGLPVAATKQQQTARLCGKVGVLECSDASSEPSGETSEKDAPWATRLDRGTNHDPQTYVYTK